jgi:O-antigen chain-terminating methyltransferase
MSNEDPSDVAARMDAIRARSGMPVPNGGPGAEGVLRTIRDALMRRGAATAGAGFHRWQRAAARLVAKREYSREEWLAAYDMDFIHGAYSALLQRAPDAGGAAYFLRELRAGNKTKLEILGDLRFSPEGMARGVHVDGLMVPYWLLRLRRRRFIGTIVSWVLGVLRLRGQLDREARSEAALAYEMHALGQLHNVFAEEVEARLDNTSARLADIREEAALAHGIIERTLTDAMAEVQSRVDALEQLQGRVAALELVQARVDALEQLQGRVDALVPKVEYAHEVAREAATIVQREKRDAANATALDPLYARFEDEFRGTRESVTERLMPYLDMIVSVQAAVPQMPVVDLGCGRGEWLALLRKKDVRAFGVDTNRVFVDDCHAQGLEVVLNDAIEVLSGLPDASVGAITAMHLVEHLPFDAMIRLFDQAYRVLRSGGVMILETPNPENLQVASHWFYLDPTHRNPLPPEALKWLVQARGFSHAEIARQTIGRTVGEIPPVPDDVPGSASINAALAHYAAAPDYAVIAWKP